MGRRTGESRSIGFPSARTFWKRCGSANAILPSGSGGEITSSTTQSVIIAIVEVTSSEARYDASKEWERQSPLVLDVKPLLKAGRVSRAPSTSSLGLDENLAHESYVPLTNQQYEMAAEALRRAVAG